MCEQLTIDYQYQCLHEQDKGYLLAIRKVSGELPEGFVLFHRRLDSCSHHELPAGEYIQLVFYGNHLLPFAILVPYSEENYKFYNENKHKVFDIVVANQPKPFGKDMYRCKEQ